MPPGHPLAAKCSIGVEDLDGVPLITMTRRYPSRHRIEQLFRRAGIPMRLRAETNLSGTICDLVRLGHGVAILNGQIGRASRRERVCQYVLISVVAESLKEKIRT